MLVFSYYYTGGVIMEPNMVNELLAVMGQFGITVLILIASIVIAKNLLINQEA